MFQNKHSHIGQNFYSGAFQSCFGTTGLLSALKKVIDQKSKGVTCELQTNLLLAFFHAFSCGTGVKTRIQFKRLQ